MFSASAVALFTSLPPSLVRSGMPHRWRNVIRRMSPGARTPDVPKLVRESTARQGRSGTNSVWISRDHAGSTPIQYQYGRPLGYGAKS